MQRRCSETTAINHNWAKWEGKISGKTVTRTLNTREKERRCRPLSAAVTCYHYVIMLQFQYINHRDEYFWPTRFIARKGDKAKL